MEAAWAAEIEKRARRVIAGESQGIPSEDVRARGEAVLPLIQLLLNGSGNESACLRTRHAMRQEFVVPVFTVPESTSVDEIAV